MFVSEGNTRAQIVLTRKRHTRCHEGFVLVVVITVTCKVATACELGDLLTDELLFIKAVAQSFVHQGRVEVEAGKHEVTGQPLTVVGETRVGFNEVARVVRIDGE